MVDDDDDWIAPDDHLNLAAYRAIMGWTENREETLAALLVSDQPLHRIVRLALAEALTSKHGARVTIKKGHGHQGFVSFDKRMEWMRIGRVIQSRIDAGERHKDVMAALLSEMGERRPYLESCLAFYRKARAWALAMKVPGTMYEFWPEDRLEERFAGYASEGKEPPRNLSRDEAEKANIGEARAYMDLLRALGLHRP